MIPNVEKVVSVVQMVSSMDCSFEITRDRYQVEKTRYEISAREFAYKCFDIAKEYGVLKQECELVDYSFKDWNIELTYLWQGKKFGIIFDYTDGDLNNIITKLKKGLYDTVYYTKKERK